jgi:ech hydrogenase subunit A
MWLETLVLLTMALPALGAVLAFATPDRARRWVVLAFAAIIIAVGSVLALGFLLDGEGAVVVDDEGLFDLAGPVSLLITVLDYALMAFLIYLGARSRSIVAAVAAGAQIAIIGAFEVSHGLTTPETPLLLDRLSLVLVSVCCIVGSLIAVFAVKYMEGRAKQGRFFAFVLLFLGAMNGAVLSNDLLWFFFFWEVTTLCSFYLIFHDETEEARASARLALEVTLGGGVALAMGIAYTGWQLGTLELDVLTNEADVAGLALLVPALFVLGGMTKSAQLPFQSWLLGAMVAPTPVSALLHSSTMVNLGVYAILRMAPLLRLYTPLTVAVALMGGITFAATAGLALTQRNAKRLLAYSTIGNLGLVVMCVGINTPASLVAAVFVLLFHAVSKGMLFLSVGVIDHEMGTKDIEEMEGVVDRYPFVAHVILLGAASMMLPPFGLFAGKWLSVEASTQMPSLLLLLGVGSAATILYYTKWVGRLISSGPGPRREPERLSRYLTAPLAAISAMIVCLSVLAPLLARDFVFPSLPPGYGSPASHGAADLLGGVGYMWIGAIFIVLLLGFLLPLALIRVHSEDRSKVYTCGEPVERPEVSGSYFGGARTELAISDLAVAVAAGLAIAVMLMPVIAEVV